MSRFTTQVALLTAVASILVLESCSPPPVQQPAQQQPFTIEIGCTIPLNTYNCTQTVTPSATKRFLIETVSFSGQATVGQTVGGNFSFTTGGTAAFVWLPVQSFGASPSAGTGLYVATLPVRLSVDANSSIKVEVYRNLSTNAGQNTPYAQRLNLMGYLQ